MATCLMTGLVTDTGNFTNLGTTASAIEVASKLLLHGVDLRAINKRTMHHRPLPVLKLWGRALERLRRDAHGVVTTIITQQDLIDCGTTESDIEGVANFLNNLDSDTEARVVMVLSERDGQVKGSLRTKHPLIDVAKFATVLGGGGHTKAAGFSVPGHLEEHGNGWLIVSTPTPERALQS
jgi:phosphoesterase RecJ-like protein